MALNTQLLTDLQVAQAWAEAETAGDEEAVVIAMNEAIVRAGIPLDETEQGITPAASERLEQWYADAFKGKD